MSDPGRCSIEIEDAFGPIVNSPCFRGFDFTLLFEEGILTILPLGIAVVWAFCRILALRNETTKVKSSWLLPLKMLVFASYIILQVALSILWILRSVPKSRLTIACNALTIFGYCTLLVLSYLEHTRSLRPSNVLCVYFVISIPLDLPRIRTLFFLPGSQTVARFFLASFVIKVLLFALEVSEKRRLLCLEWSDASPEATSSVISRALFLWLNTLLRRGFRTLLSVDTLTPLDSELLHASRPAELMKRWERSDKASEHALFWTFLIHYKWSFLVGVLPRLAYTGFSFSQPFLVERVLDFIAEPADVNSNNTAYALITAYAIVYIGISISYAVYEHKTYRLLTMVRGSLISLIFDKTLRMNSSDAEDAEAITLMSADIDRINSSIDVVHDFYASLVESAIGLWLLYKFLGLSVVAPILWVAVSLLIALPLAKAAGNAQTPWLEAIEDRLAGTAKALSAMKGIKMTGLGEIVSSQIADLRLSEIHASRRHRVLNIFVSVNYFATTSLAPVWGFAVYILLARANNSGTLTEGIAFAALSIFELLNAPMGTLINGFEEIQTVLNSFRRVQEYLTSEEREDYRIIPDSETAYSSPGLSRQQSNDELPLLDSPSLTLVDSEYVAIVKDASASYSPERGSILKSLTFQIPKGQTTMIYGPVGSGKSTLLRLLLGEMPFTSGSVGTRFSRAAYCPQSPWCIWGTVQNNIVGMSEWDKTWYDTIVSACALSADFAELPNGDQTNVGTRGSRLSGGQQMRVSFARSLYSRNPIMILDDVLAGLDRATERHILNAVFAPDGLLKNLNSTIILATSSGNHLEFSDHVIFLDENGEISRQGAPNNLSVDSGDVPRTENRSSTTTTPPDSEPSEDLIHELKMLDDLELGARRVGDMKIYAYYAKIAGWWTVSIYLFACAAFVFGVTFPSVWLQWWTNANALHPNERIGYWLGVFGAFAVVPILGSILADCVLNLVVLPKTSRRFHEILLTTTMQAPSSFLTSTDAGTTINRFSQDLELIDNDLPHAIDGTIFAFLSAIVSAVLVFISSGYVAAAFPLCILALGFIQFYYLRSSRQLRLLEIETKAPLFSHFLETIKGVASIRAYGWSQNYIDQNYETLNISQQPYYLLYCVQIWLTLVLDLFNAGVAILIVALATSVRGGSSGFLGVALFNIVIFSSTLQGLITQWTHVEMALGAINRIRSYVSNVKSENLSGEVSTVPEDWPRRGAIVFKDISASYESSLGPVLKEITFNIEPGEKIAICGRTGSGKSSLVSTLLRILEIDSGAIFIDDIDITTIPRQEVRKRLDTLPQDPFFLHGSVRENLDPLNIASDERIVEVLRAVSMWSLFESRGGLAADMSEDKLSQGQRQLFCLARAVVKPGSILIMDEATSSVDSETEQLMQKVLRKEFEGRTVIAVAHKLNTVLDFDRVVLLEKGRVIEVGNPQTLLAERTSLFRALYESLGHAAEGS